MASTSALSFLIFAGCAGVLVLACFALSRLLRQPTSSRDGSDRTADSSRLPENPGRRHLTIPFHRLIAVAVVFQAAVVLLYAWAMPLRRIIEEGGNQTALAGLAAFVAVIATGYAYVWSQGGFDWDPQQELPELEPAEWDGGP